jgi:hypothetical protein
MHPEGRPRYYVAAPNDNHHNAPSDYYDYDSDYDDIYYDDDDGAANHHNYYFLFIFYDYNRSHNYYDHPGTD